MKTLCASEDLELFEQEAIQVIIDYKWNAYARSFFIFKLVIYFVFEVFFFIDVENLNHLQDRSHFFYVVKGICITLMVYFLQFEVTQFMKDKENYAKDMWNYGELSGIFCYLVGSIISIF